MTRSIQLQILKLKHWIIFILSYFLAGSSINAQTILMDSVKNICSSIGTISTPIRAKSFKKVLGIQGSITWDTTVFKYNSIIYGNSVIALNSGNIILDKASLGTITYVWTDTNSVAETVLDSTILFTLQFKVLKSVTGSKNISFSSIPTTLAIAMIDSSGGYSNSYKASYQNGNVSFINTPIVIKNHDTLSSIVSGSPSYYQWNLNGVAISGANSSVYNSAKVAGGSYSLTVKYTNGCATSSATVLPNQQILLSGYYQIQNNTTSTVRLNWKESEFGKEDFYLLERSTNGTDYVPLQKMYCNRDYKNDGYHIIDTLNNEELKYFYRLKSFNSDGNYFISNIVCVSLPKNNNIELYPNPAKDWITLHFFNNKVEYVKFIIKDFSGKVILEKRVNVVNGINSIPIHIAPLKQGNYFITLDKDSSFYKQFIKL